MYTKLHNQDQAEVHTPICLIPNFVFLTTFCSFSSDFYNYQERLARKDSLQFSSVQFSRSVVSNPLPSHEPQHARPPCPSPTPGVHPNSCPLSQWCHPNISSSVIPLPSHPQFFPASGSFQKSELFASGGQSIGVWASTAVLPMNTQDWSPLGWTGWISLQSKGLSESSPTPQFKSINSSALFCQVNSSKSCKPIFKFQNANETE